MTNGVEELWRGLALTAIGFELIRRAERRRGPTDPAGAEERRREQVKLLAAARLVLEVSGVPVAPVDHAAVRLGLSPAAAARFLAERVAHILTGAAP